MIIVKNILIMEQQNKKKYSNKFLYNKNLFGTNLRITEIQSVAGLEQLKELKKIQKKREEISKDYFNTNFKVPQFH